MTKRFAFAALALAACFATLPAAAQTAALPKGASRVELATPLKTGFDPVIDGRIWHCDGSTCYANPMSTASGRSIVRECGDVASKTGVIASFQTGADVLTDDQLKTCNASATKS
jgi:hypothetical protein